jgi:hypothetical protein
MERHSCRLSAGVVAWTLLLLVCGCSTGDRQGTPFQDDFGDSRSGWGTDQREEFDRGYDEGEYFFELHEPNWFAWAYPGAQFDDAEVEVDARLSSGPPSSHFGVLCRYTDEDNFYYFTISADGYYAIFRRENGRDPEVITGDGEGMAFSSAIRTGEQSNHIRAICQEDELSLYVNGELLETINDRTHSQGDVGLGAGSGAEGGARIHFDDFAAARP